MKPYVTYPLLTVGILAISSAATAFDELGDVGGCLKASWRLQFTAYV